MFDPGLKIGQILKNADIVDTFKCGNMGGMIRSKTTNTLVIVSDYDYPTFHLSMDCFWCEVIDGELKLVEAEAAKWLTKETIYDVKWLPADITLVEKIKAAMN